MNPGFQLFPHQGSAHAAQVDALVYFMLGVTAFFTLLIAALIVYLALRYRRDPKRPDVIPAPTRTNHLLEATWIGIPSLLVIVMFVWGTHVFLDQTQAPANAMEINVVAKQWMWKIQHPEGRREIDELHVPAGRAIKLIMISQDVVHDFGLPGFRIKRDVIPGRFTSEWFEPTRVGEYHLFCDQYCGAQHAGMVGTVYVMEPAKYEQWLNGSVPDESPAWGGGKLFIAQGCATCHSAQAPTMAGLYMSKVNFVDLAGRPGSTVADEDYIRQSILDPRAKIVDGYQNQLMPSFAGKLSEEQIVQIIEYIKSLRYSAAPAHSPALEAHPSGAATTGPSPELGK